MKTTKISIRCPQGMFDRPEGGERTLLVQVVFDGHLEKGVLVEFEELAKAAGAEVISAITASRDVPDAKTYVGSGKVEEIKQHVNAEKIDLVLFNHELSPSQERNLEKELKCRVLSRTGLILDIFAKRAQTFEGQLQVELAQLKHMSTRLIRGWTHLERQKGGIGLRGPGETQLETDRRLLKIRIRTIEERLEKVRQQRAVSRKMRERREVPTIALVGYTNAGKSTLFNALTGAHVFEANQLFATLDPTHRSLTLPGIGKAILVDTVGFIRDLPHELVEAFQATLEETVLADVLCHVADVSNPDCLSMMKQVEKVLVQLHAEQIPTVQVFNKIDALVPTIHPQVDHQGPRGCPRIWLSARDHRGLDILQETFMEVLGENYVKGHLVLGPTQGATYAQLHEWESVLDEQVDEQGFWHVKVTLLKSHWQQLCHKDPSLSSSALTSTEMVSQSGL